MQILRKVTDNDALVYYIKTDLGLIIKIKSNPSLNNAETKQMLIDVAKEMDDKLRSNIE
ncbi:MULTISPECIES: hypothetical protein [Staphylococcus]|jgi:hypothetical protein|uniref:hypothetical protein n=1 Tax=Staphylococcus TaxID=1279 RepID=UPI000B34030E|nr:hypothetical protein [Staphylococcus shinii]MBO3066091.1 hypothetical protein [Staphylococcus shinii]MDW8564412.1 hypothetical protein [Staphylococcus shinii]MDW8567643.1 hypothetical protein [Staphylococcus shinii]MDW8570511.1 hypothetical protein [Staphylococcus shinii]MDW8573585.1 hypothetical protein [Staphylococcus shinii]